MHLPHACVSTLTTLTFILAAAIPPTRGRSSSGSRPTGNQIYRTSSTNSASVILEGLPDFKPPERQYVVYHWGGGISSPTKLTLPQHDSDVVQVASGRTLKTGVTGGGRMIIWDSNKTAVNVSSDAADKGMLLEDLWVPRFLEGQSGVTIVQVSCGDLFVACLTGTCSSSLGCWLFHPQAKVDHYVISPYNIDIFFSKVFISLKISRTNMYLEGSWAEMCCSRIYT